MQITYSPPLTEALFFVRSGIVYIDSKINIPGSGGNYWSRNRGEANAAFLLGFGDSVFPSNNVVRATGRSLRCLHP